MCFQLEISFRRFVLGRFPSAGCLSALADEFLEVLQVASPMVDVLPNEFLSVGARPCVAPPPADEYLAKLLRLARYLATRVFLHEDSMGHDVGLAVDGRQGVDVV